MESFVCTCKHHLIRHDEDGITCQVAGCACRRFTPVPAVPVSQQLQLVQVGNLLAAEVAKLNIRLNQRPIDARGLQDALEGASALYHASGTLVTALVKLSAQFFDKRARRCSCQSQSHRQ